MLTVDGRYEHAGPDGYKLPDGQMTARLATGYLLRQLTEASLAAALVEELRDD